MHIADGFILREIAGETIAIPSGESARQLSGLVALNDSGKYLFELLRSEQTAESLTAALLQKFEIDSATAAADVAEFLSVLRTNGILVDD